MILSHPDSVRDAEASDGLDQLETLLGPGRPARPEIVERVQQGVRIDRAPVGDDDTMTPMFGPVHRRTRHRIASPLLHPCAKSKPAVDARGRAAGSRSGKKSERTDCEAVTKALLARPHAQRVTKGYRMRSPACGGPGVRGSMMAQFWHTAACAGRCRVPAPCLA